jgi:PAS domain S-box-containing protein
VGHEEVVLARRDKPKPIHREREISVGEARFRAFADHVADAYHLHDEHGVILDVNRRACDMLGYSREELIGMAPWDFDADAVRHAQTLIRAQLAAGKEARFDTYHRRKDGSTFPVEVRLFPYQEEDRRLGLALISDITERKRAEEVTLRLNRELRAITMCHQMLLRTHDEHKLLNEVCRIICDEAGYRLAWVGYIQHDEAKTIVPMAVAGHDQGYLESIIRSRFTWAEDSEHGRGGAGEAIRTGKIVYVADIVEDPRVTPWRERALERGYRSALCLPLKDEQGVVFGVMLVYADRPHSFTDDDVRLMEELTQDLAFGICVLRDRNERRRAEGSLQVLNRELQAISCCHQTMLRVEHEQVLLDEICRIICEEAGYRMAWVGYVEHDEAKSIRSVAWSGLDSGYIKDAALTWDGDSPYGRGPSGIAVCSGDIVYAQDIATDPRMAPWRERALQRGYRSSVAVPLKGKDGQVFGVLTIYSADTHAISSDEIRLLGELADDMAFGIQVLRMRAERDLTEQALRENEERYRTIFQSSPLGMFRSTINGRFIEVNPALAEMIGYADPESMIRDIRDIGVQLYADPDERQRVLSSQMHASGDIMTHLNRYLRRDGSERTAKLYLKTIRNDEGVPAFFDGIVEDITERMRAEEEQQRLEAQLMQAQKMESIGRLAGGVAHDFNNMLGAIMGYSDLALSRIDPGDQVHGYLQEVRKAADRSADLTRQLLAFARKQNVVPKILDLNETVGGMLNMLRRLIGEEVRLEWLPAEGLWPVEMDPSQVDQILANLCVNARDAIEGNGCIRIWTANVHVDVSDFANNAECVPGAYVCLSIRDDGCGMDEDILHHVFEPFFTTKESGKGTGLGLSTVYGIVKQNGGFLRIDSEPGKGTTFHLFLPRHAGMAEGASAVATRRVALSRGHETILLVEDETALLNIAHLMLKECGYGVLVAASPAEAIALATAYIETGEIDLLITDMVMPGMNGRDLARSLGPLCPGMSCLFMSGYTDNVISHGGELDADIAFIQKPFSMPELLARVRVCLDEKSAAGA